MYGFRNIELQNQGASSSGVAPHEPQIEYRYDNLIIEQFTGQPQQNLATFKSPASDNPAICALCMRQAAADRMISFSNCSNAYVVDALEGARMIFHATGIKLTLDTSAVCRTCWTLVKMIMDFRDSCLQVASWMDLFPKGLEENCSYEDHWLTGNTKHQIDSVHTVVKEHISRIERAKEIKMSQLSDSLSSRSASPADLNDDFDEQNGYEEIKIEHGLDHVTDNANGMEADQSTKAPEKKRRARRVKFDDVVLEKDNLVVNILSCTRCGRNFNGSRALEMHLKRCNGSESTQSYHTCPICTATYISAKVLLYHINAHKGIKPFKCRKYCDSTFSSKNIRHKHETYYCELEKRVCPICGAMLKHTAGLEAHLAEVHDEEDHHCTICNKVFKGRKTLKNHMAVHSDVRKYKCKYCDKSFKKSYSANNHMRLHTNEKPFVCQLCNQAFISRPSLLSHHNRHHGCLE